MLRYPLNLLLVGAIAFASLACEGDAIAVPADADVDAARAPLDSGAFHADSGVTDAGDMGSPCDEIPAEATVGVLRCDSRTAGGYTLFAPLNATSTYLIDIEGHRVHSWPSSYQPGNAVYLLEDGSLLRTGSGGRDDNPRFRAGGAGGHVELISWEGEVTWRTTLNNEQHRLHHDVEMLPNGNILVISWEYKNREETIEAGRDPERIPDDELWPDLLFELQPQGSDGATIVWEWHMWDHLIQDFDENKANYGVVADHPELMDINFPTARSRQRDGADWNHINAVDYNASEDLIILSLRGQDEVIIIDHSTTTEEAAGHSGGSRGHGGDILYRWGNPASYRAGTSLDQRLGGQHDAQWIAAGSPGEGQLLIYNNTVPNIEGRHSNVLSIELPRLDANGFARDDDGSWGPGSASWTYMASGEERLFSRNISGAQRLANGNTLICEGASGRFIEVTGSGEVVWEYVNPMRGVGALNQGDSTERAQTMVFRAKRYQADFPGLAGRDLSPGPVLEGGRP